MSLHRIARSELLAAREEFGSLLKKPHLQEQTFQDLFTRRPYILSQALPVRVNPVDVIPQGRPGRDETDFLFYPQEDRVPFLYGAFELKRPDTPIFSRADRKDLLVLSHDSLTALKQAQKHARKLKLDLERRRPRLMALGSDEYLFLILGLQEELARRVANAELRRQFEEDQLPRGCRLLPYDTLYQAFEQSIPRNVYMVRTSNVMRGVYVRPGTWLTSLQDFYGSPDYVTGMTQKELGRVDKGVLEIFERGLNVLRFRDREVHKLLYGYGTGYKYTLWEVGRIFKLAPRSVAAIEARSLRRLRGFFQAESLNKTVQVYV